MVGLTIDPRVHRNHKPQEIADVILAAIGEAAGNIAETGVDQGPLDSVGDAQADAALSVHADLRRVAGLMAEVRGIGVSDAEDVRATAAASGMLITLEIDSRIRRHTDSDGIAEAVLAACSRAAEQARAGAASLFAKDLSLGSEGELLAKRGDLTGLLGLLGAQVRHRLKQEGGIDG